MAVNILSNIRMVKITEELTRSDLLERLSALAIGEKFALPGFKEAVLTREEKYPTGLHANGLELAIPHADPEWTVEPAMIAAVLDKPVQFEPMGGQGDTVQATFVFLLVIPDADAHITFLQGLVEFIEDEARLKELDQSKDISLMVSFLSETMGA